jgi:flagellar motor switch protein FliN/FliY
MNQMMGSSATSMSTIFNRFVNISPPGIDILDVDNGNGVNSLPPDDEFINVSFRLMIGDLIDSTIMQLLPISFAKQMVATLMGSMEEEPAPALAAPAPASAPVQVVAAPAAVPPAAVSQPAAAVPPAAIPSVYAQPEQQAYAMPPQVPNTYGQHSNRNVNVQPIQFANFQGAPYVQADDTNLNLLLDIPLKVTVELGRTQKQIKDILELSQGSIIELDKLAGEPVDILVNNKLIAKGEVVVIDENFGVRVTDIVSQWDRMQKIQ